MSFDLRPVTRDDPADGQIIQSPGDPTGVYNCTLAALRDTAFDLGYGHPFDLNQMRNDIRAEFGSKGLSWDNSIRVARDMFPPGLAACMEIKNGALDLRAAVLAAGEQGWMVHGGFICDTYAHVPPQGPATYSHALRCRQGDDGGSLWQNVEPWPDMSLPWDQWQNLYDGGGILVFKQSLISGGNDLGTLDGAQADELNQIYNNTDQVNKRFDDGARALLDNIYNRTDWAIGDLRTNVEPKLDQLLAAVAKVSAPVAAQVDVNALAAALAKVLPASSGADPHAVAHEVVVEMGAQFNKP